MKCGGRSLIIGFRMYFLHENELIKLSRKDATATEEERILKEPCDQELCNILVRYEIYITENKYLFFRNFILTKNKIKT